MVVSNITNTDTDSKYVYTRLDENDSRENIISIIKNAVVSHNNANANEYDDWNYSYSTNFDIHCLAHTHTHNGNDTTNTSL